MAYTLALTGVLLFPSPKEQERISKPYSECLRAAAERTDDGQSDIAIVGEAVASACKAEFDHVVAKLGERLSPNDRQTLYTKLKEMQIGYATVAVGEVRRQRRGPADH